MVDFLLSAGTTIGLPLLVSTIVSEKQHRLRALMVMMGLDMRYYWLCVWMWNSAVTLITNLLVFLLGNSQNIQFLARSPAVSLALLLVWSQALVSLSMLMSAFFNKTAVAYLVNFAFVVLMVLVTFLINQDRKSTSTVTVTVTVTATATATATVTVIGADCLYTQL